MGNSGIAVLKFGGTSMGSADTIRMCSDVIQERIAQNKKPFVVVSAISKMTDTLLNLLYLAKNGEKQDLDKIFQTAVDRHFEILNNLTTTPTLTEKYIGILKNKFASLYNILSEILLVGNYSEETQAVVLSYGEDLSSELMEACLAEYGINGRKIHSKNLVKTFGNCLSANVDFTKTKKAFRKIFDELNRGVIFIMTGFFGSGNDDKIMLLGRGGSDFSGSVAGISLDADVVEIWTDADGVMSADPRLIKDARSWGMMNKDVAFEMARAGAKVLHPKTISASYHNINLLIQNLFNRNFMGTLIDSEHHGDGVKGIVSDDDYSIIHLENHNMFGETGFVAKIGIIASENNIPIDMVATSETSITFTVKAKFLNDNALKLFNSMANCSIISNTVKISIIGENIANSETLEKIFAALKISNIEPLMVTMGRTKSNIGIMVMNNEKNNSLLILHKTFIQ